jgi:hypothetical protein
MTAYSVAPAKAGAAQFDAIRLPLAAPARAGVTASFGVRHAR